MGEGRRHRSLISRMKRVTGSENFGDKKIAAGKSDVSGEDAEEAAISYDSREPLSLFLSLSVPLVPSFVLFSRTSLLSPTWLRITLLCVVSSWLVNFLPAFSPSRLLPLRRTSLYTAFFFFSAILLPHLPLLSPVSSSSVSRPFRRSSTLVADQLHGRSYRAAMTRKWNVLSRAVIHLLQHAVPPPRRDRHLSSLVRHPRRFSRT